MLDRHADGSVNFHTKLIVGTGPKDIVTRVELKDAVKDLFADDTDVSLFYFAGHGYIESTGGYLCGGDCKTGDDGLPLSDIMSFATSSPARNKDHHSRQLPQRRARREPHEQSGLRGRRGHDDPYCFDENQYAKEKNGGGAIHRSDGRCPGCAAANVVGEVTPGSVYAHVDQSTRQLEPAGLYSKRT